MSTPKPYTAKDGTTTWRVRYRDPSNRSCSRTFIERRDAQWFADTIAARGVPFALRALADLERELHGDDSPTLSAVWAEFITWKADYVRSRRTIVDYTYQYQDSIDPTLGSLPIATITPAHVTDWLDALVAGKIKSGRTGKRLSPKTIAGRHSLLHAVMEYAADPRRRYITANPCTGAHLPKRITPPPKGLMPAEWQALHAALTQLDQHAADLAAFLIGSGFRWGEASALTPAAVEDYGRTMYVTMMQVQRRDESGAVSIAEDEGKAQKSMRRIHLDPDTAAIIRHRSIGLAPSAPIFHSGDGQPWTYNGFRYVFRKAVAVANLSRKPTIHWLRHTHVAWMAMSGAALPELQSRIGHASIQTTIGVYGSLITDVKDSTLEAFSVMRASGPTTPLQVTTGK